MEKIDPRPRNCVQKSWIGRGHCMQEEKRNRTLDACMRPQKTVLRSSKKTDPPKRSASSMPHQTIPCASSTYLSSSELGWAKYFPMDEINLPTLGSLPLTAHFNNGEFTTLLPTPTAIATSLKKNNRRGACK